MMGCGASKNDVIKSSEAMPKKDNSVNSATSEASTIPAYDGDNYQQNGRPPKVPPPSLKPLRNPREKPPEPIAFEVPGDDGEGSEDGSLIKKHPPRRLRQLEDTGKSEMTLTQEDIDEKVALANKRRNEVLTQRVASARQKSGRGGRSRKPAVMHSDQYDMAELEHEIYGNNNVEDMGEAGGGGFSGRDDF